MRTLILFLIFSGIILNPISAQSVYKTPSGTKYHLSTCRMVENVSEKITIQEAIRLHLSPCKICKPPVTEFNQITPQKSPQGKKETSRCKGNTKGGVRCKHMTSIGNGYCYQHQPPSKT